ncbi:hypothetical protein GCM10025738_15980 [Microbacterium fluvii]
MAEFAVALPAVAAVILLGAAGLGAAALQVRTQDAAADAARLLARGESDARISAAVEATAPGAAWSGSDRGDLVCATVSARASLPLSVSATSCALAGGG